jgi:transposase
MMRVIYECVAGLDVHKKTVVATRMRLTSDKRIVWETETFGTMTPDLLKLHDWLQAWPISHVAMESTGDYWKPVYNLLEDDFEMWVVNAQHVKRVPGRKTDVTDAEWLAELMLHGLLKASFVPEKPQRGLRDLTRSRVRLIEERSRVVNRVQKLLEGANIKLSSVVTDVQGVSARAMLAELAEGNTNANAMAELARGRLRNKIPELEKALTGIVESHHRFLLSQHLAHIDFLDEQIAALEAEIERCIRDMGAPPAPPSTSDGTDAPETPAEAPTDGTWEPAVTLLDSIPGIDRNAAEAILAEIGADMTRFPTTGHLCRWGGVAPGNNESGGKRHSGRTPKGNRALTRTLVQCAHAAVRTKGSFFKARYHRLAARRGKKRAIMAIAHSMLIAIWHMLTTGSFYDDLGEGYYDERHKERKIAYHARQLEKLMGGTVQVAPSPAMA